MLPQKDSLRPGLGQEGLNNIAIFGPFSASTSFYNYFFLLAHRQLNQLYYLLLIILRLFK